MAKRYQYLLVGAGLFSAVFAHEMTKRGKRCLIIDRRNHVAGNIYTQNQDGIFVHKYGAHIFHTSNQAIWDYVNAITPFHSFINQPIANYKGKMYNLPFNMNTFAKMWDVCTPQEAHDKIAEQVRASGIVTPHNLEQKAISLVGTDIYEELIKGYTEKQWGCPCAELPESIINRLPLRFTFDNNYFNDRYQGIPTGGYTRLIERLLQGVEVLLDTPFSLEEHGVLADKILYTGSVDELLNYEFGELEYRSLRFEEKVLKTENFQGNAVVNYTEKEVPYTRCIEHKFFEWVDTPTTVVTYEYPVEWSVGNEAYYPMNNPENAVKYKQYKQLLHQKRPEILLGGRLGLYEYLDMDMVVERAILMSREQVG